MFAAAVDVGLEYLRELNVEFVCEMTPELHAWCTGAPAVDVADERTFHLHPVLAAEPASDPFDILRMSLMGSLIPGLYMLQSPRIYSTALTMLALSMRRGTTPDTANALTVLGLLTWPTNELRLCFALGEVAHMLMEQFGELGRAAAPRSNSTNYGHLRPVRRATRAAACT